MRVMSPDARVAQVDGLSGHRYTARGGVYEMPDRDGRALVEAGGFLPSLAGASGRAVGFRCPGCGFGSYLRTCSRCGSTCDREAG